MPPPSPGTTDLESADPFGPAKTLSPVEQVAAWTVGLPADDLESADPFGPAEDPLTPVEQVAASTVGLDLRERDPVEEAEEAEEVRRLFAPDLESADPFGPAKTTDLESADPFGMAGPRKPLTSAERTEFLQNYLAWGAYTGRAVPVWHDTGEVKKRYDPVADSWSMTSWVRKTIQLPTSRFTHPADRPDPAEGGVLSADEIMPPTDEERADLKGMWEREEIPDRVYWNEIQRIDRDLPEYKGMATGELAQKKFEFKEQLTVEGVADVGTVDPMSGKLMATPPMFHPKAGAGPAARFVYGVPQGQSQLRSEATTLGYTEVEAYKTVANIAGVAEFLWTTLPMLGPFVQPVAPGEEKEERPPGMGQWMDPHRTGRAGWLYNALRFGQETVADTPLDYALAIKDAWDGGTYDEYFAGSSDDPSAPNYKPGLHDLDYEIREIEATEDRPIEQTERLGILKTQYADLKDLRDAKLRTTKLWRNVTDRMGQNIEMFNQHARVRKPEDESEISDVGESFGMNLAADVGAIVSIIPHLLGMAVQSIEWIGDPRHASEKWATAALNVGSFGHGVGYHFYTYVDDPSDERGLELRGIPKTAWSKFIREPLMVALDVSLVGSILKGALAAGGRMSATSATRTALNMVVPATLRKYGPKEVAEHARIVSELVIEYNAKRINGSTLDALMEASAVRTKDAVFARMEQMVKEGALTKAEFNSATAKLSGEMAGVTPFEVIIEKAPEAGVARRLAELEESLPSAEVVLSRAEDAAKVSAAELIALAQEAGDLASVAKADAYMADILKTGGRMDETRQLFGDAALELTQAVTSPKIVAAFQTALDIIDPTAGVRMATGMKGTEMLGILKERIRARKLAPERPREHRAVLKLFRAPKRTTGVLEADLARRGRWGEVVKTARLGVEAAQAELKTALGLKDKAAIKTARTRLKKAKSDLRVANKRGAKAATGAQQIAAGYSTLEKLLKDIGFERVVLNGKKIGKAGPTTRQLNKAQQIADDLRGVERSGNKYPQRVQAYMDRAAADVAVTDAVLAARRDMANIYTDIASANAGIRMRSRVGVSRGLPGASKNAALWSIRFNKAAAFIDKHWGKVNPLWGIPKTVNWFIGQALKGERPGSALWRYWYHTQDSRLLEAVTVLRREAAGATDAFGVSLSNRVRQIVAELGDDSAAYIHLHEMLQFQREHIVSKFIRNPDAVYGETANTMYPYGQRFTLKEGIELTPEIQRQLNNANKYSDLIDYSKYITTRGKEAGAFYGTEGLMEVYYPEVYKDMAGKIEDLAREAEGSVYAAALKRNTRRQRLEKKFDKIDKRERDGLITKEQAAAERMAESELSLDKAEKGFDATGRRLSTDFNETLMESFPKTIKEFEEINMHAQMQRDPNIVKAFDNIDTGTAGMPKELFDKLDTPQSGTKFRDAALERYNDGLQTVWGERGWIQIGPDVGKLVKLDWGHPLHNPADPGKLVPRIQKLYPDATKGAAKTPTEIWRAPGDGWWIPGKIPGAPRKLVAIENPYAGHLVKQRLGKYGPLDGMLQADVAYDMLYSQHFMKSYQGMWGTGLGIWKAGKTILATGTHITNFLSNLLVMGPAAGMSVANPLNWEHLYRAGKEFALGERGAMYVRWIKAGGKGPAGVINRSEIVRATENGIGIHYSGALGKSRKMWGDAKGILRDPAKDFTDATFTLSADIASGSAKRIAKAFPGRVGSVIMDYPGYAYQAGDDFWRFALFIKKVSGGMDDMAAAKAGLKGFADYGALAGWANLTRVSWWGKPFLAFDASMIPQMIKFFEREPWVAKWWMHVTEQMSLQNMMAAGIDPEQLDAWLQAQPIWQRHLLLLGQLHPDWAFDGEGRLRTVAMLKYSPFQRLIKRPEESLGKMAQRAIASENPVMSGIAYGMWDYDPFKQQQLYDEDATEEEKWRARGQAWGQLGLPSTPFPISLGILSIENYAAKRKGFSLDRQRLELLGGEFDKLEALTDPTAQEAERMDYLSEEIFEMQRRSRPRAGMVRPETPGEAFEGYALGMRAPSIGRQDVKQSRVYQLKGKIAGIKRKIYLIVRELKKIKKKTPALEHYKEKEMVRLKAERNKLRAERDALKRSLEAYDSQMVEAMWTTPERPKASPREMRKLIESELGKQYGE